MPYFSYISMLHLYETLGWWTIGTDVRRVHFAEGRAGREERKRRGSAHDQLTHSSLPPFNPPLEWNELHHLQIMESLGGDARWLDRFLARHSAICKEGAREGGRAGYSCYGQTSRRVDIDHSPSLRPSVPPSVPPSLLPVYYWVLNMLFLVSPQLAYNVSEPESHAIEHLHSPFHPPSLPPSLPPVYHWVLNMLFIVSPRLAYIFLELIEKYTHPFLPPSLPLSSVLLGAEHTLPRLPSARLQFL